MPLNSPINLQIEVDRKLKDDVVSEEGILIRPVSVEKSCTDTRFES